MQGTSTHQLDALLAHPPALHGDTTHALVAGALKWLAGLPGPMRTLETGCGVSTLVFVLRGDDHVCITPYGDEPERVQRYCQEHGLDDARVSYRILRSEIALPALAIEPRDLILIDGSHAFPHVFIDYFYAAQHLAVGGVLIVDDVHLWTGSVLRGFLASEPAWTLIEEWDGRTVAFRKVAEPENRDWFDQPYVLARSTPWRARTRMTLSLLRHRDLRALAGYVRGMVDEARAAR